jgi:hypothetical protein
MAQQKEGEETTNTATPGARGNFNIIQLLNGDYLDIYGTGTSHDILRGHPSISAIELGSVSADPLIFSTNSVERMRIMPNGFVGIGTTNPATPFELHAPDASPYSAAFASTSRMRLINNNTTNNNAVELNLATVDTPEL